MKTNKPMSSNKEKRKKWDHFGMSNFHRDAVISMNRKLLLDVNNGIFKDDNKSRQSYVGFSCDSQIIT